MIHIPSAVSKLTLLVCLGATGALLACSPVSKLEALSFGSIAPPPDTVTFVIQGYRPQAGNTLQYSFVSNYSVKVSKGQLLYSTARDGFSDVEKTSLSTTYGFDLNVPETSTRTMNFADLLVYKLGIVAGQQSTLHCSDTNSTAMDIISYTDTRPASAGAQYLGLRNCEKTYIGLDSTKYDSAGNGIPDYLKLRCGLNMLSKNAAYISTAGDGISDFDKCRSHIPLDENGYTQPNQLFAYQYSTTLNADTSYDLTIANIPILNSGEGNFIAFYITETSSSGTAQTLFSAFAILSANAKNKVIKVPYWGSTTSSFGTGVNITLAVP